MDSLRRLPGFSILDDYGVLDYVLLLVAAFLLLSVARFVRQSLSPGGALRGLVDRTLKSVQNPAQQAARYERKGEIELAADIYKDLGRPDDAARCYQQLEDPILAGEYLEAMERYAEAEVMYRKGDSQSHLRNVWKAMGKWDELAINLFREGKVNMAAEAFEEARMPVKAAEIYEKAENFQKAGELYRSGHEPARAAAALEKAYTRQKMFMKDKPELAVESARLYLEVGAHADAGRLFAMAEKFREAGTAFKEAGQFREAGDHFLRAGEYDLAADSFTSAGDSIRSDLVRAEQLESEGKLVESAEKYRSGNNLAKAAELFEAAGNHSEAARCFTGTGDYRTAGECHVRAGEKVLAAEVFQKAGEYERAAQLFLETGEIDQAVSNFERCDRNYDAGLLLSQLGKIGPAISSLRMVGPESERYREASYLLGNLLRKSDLHADAVEAYQRAVEGQAVVTNTLDLYYNLADSLYATGKVTEAEDIFKQIRILKPDFRDVSQRTIGST